MVNSAEEDFSKSPKSLFCNSNKEIWDFLDVSLVLTDKDGKIHFINKKCIDLFGFADNDPVGKSFSILLPEEKRIEFELHHRKLYNRKTEPKFDTIEIFRKDGTKRVLESSVKFLNDENGKKFLLFKIKDDTDKKEIEKLSKEIDLYEKVLLATNDGIFDWDLESDTIFFSDRWKSILGFLPDELPDKLEAWEERTTEKDLLKLNRLFDKMKSSKIDIFEAQFEMRHKKGNWVDILSRCLAIRNKDKKVIRIVGSFTDVTLSNKNRILAKEHQERYEKLISNMPVGIAIYQAIKGAEDFRFIVVNKEAEKITNSSQAELEGNTLLEKFPNMSKGPLVKAFQKVYWTGETVYLPPFYYEDKKRQGWRENYIYKLKSGEIVTMFNDVTRQIERENELIKARDKAEEANRLKTEFLNNMSHEIRIPMNGILGFSEMLNRPGITEEKRKNYSKIIQSSSWQLLKIIDEILEISTLEARQKKLIEAEFCLNDFLMEKFSIFNTKVKERNISLYVSKSLDDEQVNIISDKSILNKVISNLLDNALKFTNEGYVEFGYYKENESLVLYVKDTGIGIAPDKHKLIFDHFSQASKEIAIQKGGLGLGLSIARENVNLLGGELTLESKVGEGSTFYVTIPYRTASNSSDHSREVVDEKYSLNEEYTKTILVVENDEINYLFIEALFVEEMDGDFKLLHAKNGQEAIDICKSNRAIQLVFMDIKMPGMNGYEALDIIKSDFPVLPVIALTAYSSENEKKKAIKAGFNEFISKPIDKNQLETLLSKYAIGG